MKFEKNINNPWKAYPLSSAICVFIKSYYEIVIGDMDFEINDFFAVLPLGIVDK